MLGFSRDLGPCIASRLDLAPLSTCSVWAPVQEASGGVTGSLESLYSLFWGVLMGSKLGDRVQPQISVFLKWEMYSLRR